MKTKPKRHKSLNTFKFQTFSERISSIDIDVFHKVKHPYEEEDEEITHYAQTLTKWSTENFSEGYYELRQKLPSDITTLPQLLVQKDDIMSALIDHLKSCDIESLQPTLELVVSVAKDLRKEFFLYFNPGVLQECIRLLDTREVEQIEWVFTCLAHLFKYLWANIVKNINAILPQLLPLLSTSRPSYINNFAAESFAFVARKVRDKLQFLLLSLKNVKNNPDELIGVAKLFFEVTKGVGNQFHSCTEEFFTTILKQLDDKKVSRLLFEICEHLVSHFTSFITSKTNIIPLWNTIMKVTDDFTSKWGASCDEHNAENVALHLKLIQQFITGREVLLQNPQELADFVMKLATNEKIKDFKSLHEVVIDLVSCLLTTNKILTKIKNTDSMIVKVLSNIDDEKLAVRFVEKIIKLSQFEFIVLREFLKFINVHRLNEYLSEFLAKIVYLKTGFSSDIDQEKYLGFYSLGLKSVPQSFWQLLFSKIPTNLSTKNIENVEIAVHSTVVLSYMSGSQDEFIQKVDKFVSKLCACIESIENVEQKAKLLYILLITVQYRLRSHDKTAIKFSEIIKLAAKYINSSNYLCSLRILDIAAPYSTFECLSTDEEKLRIIDNLSSPFHKVRLFSSNVLSKMNIHSIFEQISEIELIYPSIDTYRDKLQRLQKFEYNELFAAEVSNKFARLAVLKFLFGNLYINFLYMWEPTQKLIQSHLENYAESWKTFADHLDRTSINDIDSDKLMENVEVHFDSEYLKEHFYELNGVDDRPDFFNVRCLLLNVLNGVAKHSCLDKNFLGDIFLRFYKLEYAASNSEYSAQCNVKLGKERISEDDQNESSKKGGKNYNKLFIIYLKLIANISSQLPQKIRSEIFDIHFELLSNGNSEIQRSAVDYICRIKGMNSYKERLTLLTNDNSIKDQLLNIRIDLNSNLIPEKDLSYFMKIVLKILYGKVRKKSAVNLRDAMFEFLMSCKNDEVIFFFDMVFKEFSTIAKDSSDPVIRQFDDVDLENTISPSWLLNYINHTMEIFKRCGSLLQHTTFKYLLRILLKCISNLGSLHKYRSEVHPCYYGLMSKVRVNAFEAMIYFFENFEYKWTKEEMNAVFKLFVDPWIEKISEECLQSPNPLMRLFIMFTKNPKYFPLLAKKSRNLTALEVLMGLLNNDKVYFNVKNSLVEIVERLLTLEEEMEESDPSEFMYLDDVNRNVKKKNQQYGTILLMPYASPILQYLQQSLTKKYVKLNSVYMLILKRISEFGLNEEASTVLLGLLLPILKGKATHDDDIVVPLLDTIFNLFKTFKNYGKFEGYLLQIASLFGTATASTVRRMLTELLQYICEKTKKKFIDAELICGLNSNDKKWIDQPDYAERLETFKKINVAKENDDVTLYTGIFIIYNCFYMIKTEKDIALRDHSGLCLKNLCPALCQKYSKNKKELDLLLNDIVLPLIKDGIGNSNENYQHESVLLLGHLAQNCSTVHPVFRDLHVLTNGENPDEDFFENILNLQQHKRVKALKRFSDLMSQQIKPPTPYTMTFLSPLVTRCLLNQKFASEHIMINCAIEALSVICHLSSWRGYEKILKQYLLEMRKNVALRKQAIRIVSAILDAFHFDISQAEETSSTFKPGKESTEELEPMEVDEIENESEKSEEKQVLPAVRRIVTLCPSDATRVYRSIKSFLIPSLDRVFMAYDDSDQFHKLSKKDSNNDKEEMAVLSIPIAYAAVKLMTRLPKSLMDGYISTIFLKLSTYLKSRLLSIRLVARETMQNILIEIGPKYLPRLLSEMMSMLTKGFQIHVLVFTCHAILEKVKNLFTEGQIDHCIDPILEICIVDLFGKVSEEKEIGKIAGKTPEARGNKSYNMLSILSEHISECHVLDLVLPLKEILSINMSTKTVNKVRRCLQYISVGLTKNQFVGTESLLEFAYGVSNDCIPALTSENENNKVRLEPTSAERPDSLLIPEEPRKMKPELKRTIGRTNAHVIIEFGLEILESMLKREQLQPHVYRPRLDPFVPLIKDCLHSQHIRLKILTLKCLVKLFKKNLPSLNENLKDISESIFTILGEYSSPAMTGDNAELLMSAAKAALVLVHDVGHQINNDQLRIMLFVAEDLLKNVTHYGTGFSLLRAIIKRKYNLPEVHSLMKIISELSIRSYSEAVRTMAREVYYKYLIDYPLGKKLRQYVLFYVSQLKYDQLDGRKSALEMLTVLVKVFPMDVLSDIGGAMFLELSCRLNLDESAECKKMAADCLTLIISRFKGTKEEKKLFDTTIIWMNENKLPIRRLAVQLLGIFASTLKEDFASKLEQVLPLVENQLHGSNSGPGKFVKAPSQKESEDFTAEKDHLLFQVLQLYKTITEVCPDMLTNPQYTEHINRIGEGCQMLLRHSHDWVRLGAAQVLGIIFKSIDAEDVAKTLKKKKSPPDGGFLRNDLAKELIKTLTLDFCDQLAPGYDVMEQLLRQTMKNLLYLAEALKDLKCVNPKQDLSLLWLLKRLIKQVNFEISHSPLKYTVRTMVFNWFAALAVKLNEETLSSLLTTILTPVVRELSTNDEQGITIRRVAKEVLKFYRQKISQNEYDDVITKVQRILDIKRAKRKANLAQMAITDPEKAARRKVKTQLKKKEQKKRRLEKLRKRKFKSGKNFKSVDSTN